MLKFSINVAVLGSIGFFASCAASTQNTLQPEPKILETVVVTGTLPGPGLWQVTSGNRVLWLMGTVSPLPKNIIWASAEAEAIVAKADEIIAPGGSVPEISASDMFKMALLARSANAAMKMPDRMVLQDVLPEPIYARWLFLKNKYMGTDRSVERLRPMFASQDLYFTAISSAGMTRNNIVWNRIAEIAEAYEVPVTQVLIKFPLAIDKASYKTGIAALNSSQINDQDCFKRTIEGLEADLEIMKQGANAWAIGDLVMLNRLNYSEVKPACKQTYDLAMGFQQRPELPKQVSSAWLAVAKRALERNEVTFAVLPIDQLVGADGYISQFKAMGYVVLEPN